MRTKRTPKGKFEKPPSPGDQAELILNDFDRLSTAAIDASSMILANTAGFLAPLASALRLCTVPEAAAEAAKIALPVLELAEAPGPSTDLKLAALAIARRIPVIAEDRKILRRVEEDGLPAFDALLMLHFLLYRGHVDEKRHEACLRRLQIEVIYAPHLVRLAEFVHQEVIKRR